MKVYFVFASQFLRHLSFKVDVNPSTDIIFLSFLYLKHVISYGSFTTLCILCISLLDKNLFFPSWLTPVSQQTCYTSSWNPLTSFLSFFDVDVVQQLWSLPPLHHSANSFVSYCNIMNPWKLNLDNPIITQLVKYNSIFLVCWKVGDPFSHYMHINYSLWDYGLSFTKKKEKGDGKGRKGERKERREGERDLGVIIWTQLLEISISVKRHNFTSI